MGKGILVRHKEFLPSTSSIDQDVQVIVPVSSHCQSRSIKTVLAYELLTVVEEVEFWFISKIP